MRAAFTLNGVWQGDETALIELMRSDEPIDRETRVAIADALERRKGIRLELHRGNTAPLLKRAETEFLYQKIADSVAARIASGTAEKRAKGEAAAEFEVSLRTVATALKWKRRTPYRIDKIVRG
jgi:hypothetical protein